MEKITELTPEEIERISAGTDRESLILAMKLSFTGRGIFLKEGKEGMDLDEMADIDALKEFFAAKGFTFIPGTGKEDPDIFITPEGERCGLDHIEYLIMNGKL